MAAAASVLSCIRALVGHRVLALLGRQVVAMATQHHDQRDAAQEENGATSGYYIIPVGGHGLQGHCRVNSGVAPAR